LRPIVGDSTVVPHITSSIIRVRSIIRIRRILAVGAIVEVVLRHLRLFIAGSVEVEEIFRIVGWLYSWERKKRGV